MCLVPQPAVKRSPEKESMYLSPNLSFQAVWSSQWPFWLAQAALKDKLGTVGLRYELSFSRQCCNAGCA